MFSSRFLSSLGKNKDKGKDKDDFNGGWEG